MRLSSSLGVGACKVVCKIASDMKKPGGITYVPDGQEAAFLAPLEVRRLPGVGPKSEQRLTALGIETIGALAALDDDRMREALPGRGWLELRDRARGIDPRPVSSEPGEAISISSEETFDVDIGDRAELHARAARDGGAAGRSLQRSGRSARTVTTKLRYPGLLDRDAVALAGGGHRRRRPDRRAGLHAARPRARAAAGRATAGGRGRVRVPGAPAAEPRRVGRTARPRRYGGYVRALFEVLVGRAVLTVGQRGALAGLALAGGRLAAGHALAAPLDLLEDVGDGGLM